MIGTRNVITSGFKFGGDSLVSGADAGHSAPLMRYIQPAERIGNAMEGRDTPVAGTGTRPGGRHGMTTASRPTRRVNTNQHRTAVCKQSTTNSSPRLFILLASIPSRLCVNSATSPPSHRSHRQAE